MKRILNPELLVLSSEHFEFYRSKQIGVVHVKGQIYEIATDLVLKHKFFELFRNAEANNDITVLAIVTSPSLLGEESYDKYMQSIAGMSELELLGYREENALAQFARLIYSLKKVVVAGFGGSVIGQFFGAILPADYRIATASTVISFPHVRYQTPPPAALSHFLPHFVGTAKSWRLIAEGKPVSATTALDLGLVDNIVADELLVDECLQKAKELSNVSSRVVEMLKSSRNIDLQGLDDRSRIESELLCTRLHRA
jgi:enoyl-CoA hydratase